jgi:hypothetical protein
MILSWFSLAYICSWIGATYSSGICVITIRDSYYSDIELGAWIQLVFLKDVIYSRNLSG